MSVNGVGNSSKQIEPGAGTLPAVQKQADPVALTEPAAESQQLSQLDKNAQIQDSKFTADVMRANLNGRVDAGKPAESATPLLVGNDPAKPLLNASKAETKLQEIAASDPAAYQAISANIGKLNDNKKQALIQVILSPGSSPQSVRLAAESMGALPESAKIASDGTKYTGVTFNGDQSAMDHLKKMKDEGKLNEGEFDALAAISKNEGQLNAVNTYDGEVVSYGLRQNSASGALQPLLKAVKDQTPEKFKEHFEDKGISLKEQNGRLLLNYKSPASGKEYNLPDEKNKGIPLEDRLHIARVFHEAGKDPQVNDILNSAQIKSARKSLAAGLNTGVAGGTVADFVGTSRGKAYVNDSFNHLPAKAQEHFKNAALDVYSKHGFDTNDPKKLNREQLFDQVARELYQKDHPGEQVPKEKMSEFRNMAKRQIEEEFIQKTKDLRMDYFRENAPKRLGEIQQRYHRIDQYFQTVMASKAKAKPDAA